MFQSELVSSNIHTNPSRINCQTDTQGSIRDKQARDRPYGHSGHRAIGPWSMIGKTSHEAMVVKTGP